MLAEIQQMSDATFRVHDWGRLGPDGKPRQLHPAEALESTDFAAGPVDPVAAVPSRSPGARASGWPAAPYFALERLRLTGPAGSASADRFTILIGLGGAADVAARAATPTRSASAQTLLLPAASGPARSCPDGEATVLTCVVP